jgi:hypothetical protein
MKILIAAALATVCLVSGASAGENSSLRPGKPAGLKVAQEHSNTLLIVAGVGLVAAGIALASSSNGGGPTAFTTQSVTGTGNTP